MTETNELVERVSKNLGVPPDTLVTGSIKEYLKAKLRAARAETHEIKVMYNVKTPEELHEKIKTGTVDEHPAWENLILYENLQSQTIKIQRELDQITG